MTLIETLIPEFEHEAKTTRKLLERVPQEKFGWKPHEKSMTLGRLASHTAETPGWLTSAVRLETLEIGKDQKSFHASSREELLQAFDQQLKEAQEVLSQTNDEELRKVWSLRYGGQEMFSMPRHAVIRNWVLNHMIHHRGQLSVYLRLLDIPVPGIYGPSADEAP